MDCLWLSLAFLPPCVVYVGGWTQGFMQAKLALCTGSYTSSPLLCIPAVLGIKDTKPGYGSWWLWYHVCPVTGGGCTDSVLNTAPQWGCRQAAGGSRLSTVTRIPANWLLDENAADENKQCTGLWLPAQHRRPLASFRFDQPDPGLWPLDVVIHWIGCCLLGVLWSCWGWKSPWPYFPVSFLFPYPITLEWIIMWNTVKLFLPLSKPVGGMLRRGLSRTGHVPPSLTAWVGIPGATWWEDRTNSRKLSSALHIQCHGTNATPPK